MKLQADNEGDRSDHVLYERRGCVAIVQLNRPERMNAFTTDMREAIRARVEQAERDPEVMGIVISGSGNAFCTGADMELVSQHIAMDEAERTETLTRIRSVPPSESPALFSFLRTTNKLVIAAVNGITAGGGVVLSLMCDLRFASDAASFVTVFARRGLIAEHGIAWLLARQIGVSGSLDLLMSSRKVGAAEALQMRLVDRVVPAQDLLESTIAYIEAMAQTVSPGALATIKRQVHSGLDATFMDSTREADRLMVAALASPDATEGVRSFVERRKPRFRPLPNTRKD